MVTKEYDMDVNVVNALKSEISERTFLCSYKLDSHLLQKMEIK